MPKPLVTVICLCYNHERFVREAVESVIKQTYEPIQIIVWDDASTDNSPAVIKELKTQYPHLEVSLSVKNTGNCRAFNSAYALAKGEFIIDFATDDVMHEQRIEKQVDSFASYPDSTGVVFTDATYINEDGDVLRHHYEHLLRHGLISAVPAGNVFRELLTTYFIASPTMMLRRSVLDRLQGYDERLAYEDFDLWVRSSREYDYAFLNERLTFIRKSPTAMSTRWYTKGDPQLLSTYAVCLKALKLCRDREDREALAFRTRYELRHSALSGNYDEGVLFWKLLEHMQGRTPSAWFWHLLLRFRLPLGPLRAMYHRLRFGDPTSKAGVR